MDIDRHGQLFAALFRRPDIQIEAVFADGHVKGRVAVKLFLVKGVHGIAELDALVSKMIRVQHTLPGVKRLGLAPAQRPHRGFGVGHALINRAAALLDTFDLSVFRGDHHGVPSCL